MNQILSDKKNIILIAALMIIIILSFFLIIHPLSNNLTNTYQAYLDKKAELEATEDKFNSLKELDDIKEDIVEANENFLKFIPNAQQTEDIMVSLDALARETSNRLPEFSVKDENDKKSSTSGTSSRFARKDIEIDLAGNFDTVLDFIQKAENLQRFNQINSLNLSACPTSGSIDLGLSLYIFYQK
ncbi:type 4a pilus biogenesis protein PilO [Patescibacteria group bacterium]